jgi:hypothetical protein
MRAYSQMLCCEHAVTARMLLQNLIFLLNYGSLPVLLLSVLGVEAIVISVYASDEST